MQKKEQIGTKREGPLSLVMLEGALIWEQFVNFDHIDKFEAATPEAYLRY